LHQLDGEKSRFRNRCQTCFEAFSKVRYGHEAELIYEIAELKLDAQIVIVDTGMIRNFHHARS